jgi:hypothetical protein
MSSALCADALMGFEAVSAHKALVRRPFAVLPEGGDVAILALDAWKPGAATAAPGFLTIGTRAERPGADADGTAKRPGRNRGARWW